MPSGAWDANGSFIWTLPVGAAFDDAAGAADVAMLAAETAADVDWVLDEDDEVELPGI